MRHARLATLALASIALTVGAHAATERDDVKIIPVDSPADILPGATRPVQQVTLGASFDGRLAIVSVTEGEHVRAGQLLAKLDDRVAAASLALAREEATHTARIDRARAQLDRNERVLKRTEEAYRGRGANTEEVAEARTNVALSKAELAEAEELHRAAQLSLKQAEARAEEHSVRAPFDGIVLNVIADPGAVLRTGDPIAEIASIDRMRADLYLPAEIALGIDIGAPYALELSEPIDRVIWAEARYVEPRIELTSNTMRVVFDFRTPDGLIPAGLLVMPAARLPNTEEMAFARGESAESRNLATVGEDR
ncbi:MAG: efflux RND transporter periplasmic adaptor subunit [Phycisphaerales bacterium]